MRILLVEDDLNKVGNLLSHLEETQPAIQVKVAESFNSALRSVVFEHFDLLLLDMTLPTFDASEGKDEGRPRPFGGKDLLDQMKFRGIAISTIVITQYESFGAENISLSSLSKGLREQFDFYLGAVYYNTSLSNWNRELDSLLAEAIRLRTTSD